MTRSEKTLIAAFLKDLSTIYGNNSCNELTLPDTPENRLLVKAANKHATGTEPDEEDYVSDDGTLCVCDWFMVDLLRHRLQKQHGITDDQLPAVG